MPDQRLTNDLTLVLEHINQVDEYFEEINTPEDFVLDKEHYAYFDAILMYLQVIGELLKRNYNEHRELFSKHNEIPWSEIIRMRDLISHHYDKLRHEVVFDICSNQLPDLKNCLKKML